MRKEKIGIGQYYHIFNRGNNKENIFFNEMDRLRFLFLILYFQFPLPIYNIGRQVSYYTKNKKFKTDALLMKNRSTELVSFIFMPNHFHFILHEIQEGGISKYMQRIQDGYTKYINAKYSKIGHLFQGTFYNVPVKTDEQLLYLSAYIHLNSREIKQWENKEEQFPWSSYQDFLQKNRWGGLLKHQIITDQFSSASKYKEFVKTSGAKSLKKNHLI